MLDYYKERKKPLYISIITFLVMMFTFQNIAFCFEQYNASRSNTLAPTSRLSPIIIDDDDPGPAAGRAAASFIKNSLKDDAVLLYATNIIGGFLKKMSRLSRYGLTDRGMESAFEEMKYRLNDDLADMTEDVSVYGDIYLSGRSVVLRYVRKGEKNETMLRYSLADGSVKRKDGAVLIDCDGTRISVFAVASDGKRKVAGRRSVYEREAIYSQKDMSGNHGARYEARRKMVEGISFEWTAPIAPDKISGNVQKLMDALLERRIDWRRDEGLEYDYDYLKMETLKTSPGFVLNEILTNAFDAFARTNNDGPIAIKIFKDTKNNTLIIDICDDGIGISTVIERPGEFSVFSNRGDPDHLPWLEGGRGIGLMWSKSVVELHGGKLQVIKNEYKKYKTTVRITLPEDSIRVKVKEPESGEPDDRTAAETEFTDKRDLGIRSMFPEGTGAFFGQMGGERVFVISNSSLSVREGSVDIPAAMLTELWPEASSSFSSAGNAPENYGNFMVADLGGRIFKFISGANSRFENNVLSLYFKLGPGQKHVLKLATTKSSIDRRRPWTIPGIVVHQTFPDGDRLHIEETFFVEPYIPNANMNVESMLAMNSRGQRYIVVQDNSEEQKEKTLRARIHIPLDVVPELRPMIDNGRIVLNDPFGGRAVNVGFGGKRWSAEVVKDVLILPVEIRPGQNSYYVLPSQEPAADEAVAPGSVGAAGSPDDALPRIDLKRERSIAAGFMDSLMLMADSAKEKGQTVIFALDDSWIPENSGAAGLIRDIERLPESLKRRGLDNVVFIRGKKDEVAAMILKERADTGARFSNVIVIGGEGILRSEEFNKLRGASKGDEALLVGLNGENLAYDSGVRILEMYLLAMELNNGKDPSLLNQDYIAIERSSDGRLRAFIFTPIKPNDVGEFKRVYDLQRKELSSSA